MSLQVLSLSRLDWASSHGHNHENRLTQEFQVGGFGERFNDLFNVCGSRVLLEEHGWEVSSLEHQLVWSSRAWHFGEFVVVGVDSLLRVCDILEWLPSRFGSGMALPKDVVFPQRSACQPHILAAEDLLDLPFVGLCDDRGWTRVTCLLNVGLWCDEGLHV